jgi:hypothetical protein
MCAGASAARIMQQQQLGSSGRGNKQQGVHHGDAEVMALPSRKQQHLYSWTRLFEQLYREQCTHHVLPTTVFFRDANG